MRSMTSGEQRAASFLNRRDMRKRETAHLWQELPQ